MAMSSGAGGDAGPRGRRRAVDAEPVDSRIAQNEIRVVLRLVVVFWVCAQLSIFCELFCRASGVKTLDDSDAGYKPPLAAQMAALAAQRLQARAGTFSLSIPQASVVFY